MRKNNISVWQARLMKSPYYKWYVLTVVQFGIILVGIGATSVNIAIPTISRVLNVPISFAQWIIVIYATTMAITLPIGGKIPQYFGRKNVVLAGFLLFSVSSILCAATSSIHLLLLYQVFLAMGSSALLANSNVITFIVFPRKQHGLALGINGTVAAIGYGLGTLLGGFLVHHYGWSAIYWLNLPFGVIAAILTAFVLDESKISESSKRQTSFDYFGCIFFSILMASLMLSLNDRFDLAERVTALSIALAGFLLFVMQERKAKVPLLDLSLFRIGSFSYGVFLRLLITVIYSSTLFFIPVYTQDYLQMNAFQCGMAMLPLSIALFFIGPLGGALSDRIGSRWVTATGFICCAIALAILASLHGYVGYKIHIGMFLIGAGMGFFVPPNNSTTLGAIPAIHIGFVSGFLWSMAYIGTATGTALSSLLLTLAKHHMPGETMAIVVGQSRTFYLLIPCAILGMVLCLIRADKNA